eukprot:jgi/Botrbrau1/12727/Bobra.67_1s0087.2
MLVAMIERDAFLGRIVTGRVASGQAKIGDRLLVLQHSGGEGEGGRLTKAWKRAGGSGRIDLAEVGTGDIVSLAGVPAAGLADTVAGPGLGAPLEPGPIDPPTLSMVFTPNDSPLSGREGTAIAGGRLGQRLQAEAEVSVSLRVNSLPGAGEAFEVQARGELQLGLLIENMRREGFEFAVSPPQVLSRKGPSGELLEPIEEVVLEVEEESTGSIIESLSARGAHLCEVLPTEVEGMQRLVLTAPSRGLIGFRAAFAAMTRGRGVMHKAFLEYGEWRGSLDRVRKGVLISTADGKTTLHALGALEVRGVLFTSPSTEVYEGMIIGEHSRDNDLEVGAPPPLSSWTLLPAHLLSQRINAAAKLQLCFAPLPS